ncbi:conserved hypothetical protein [Mesorhizobium sp. ORS 3324]|nr:conserved hypothetical protein [Mesorhizobium sp. ORS 3324]
MLAPMKLSSIQLRRVETMPKQLEPGILYVSEEFETAAHLCACGCGSKIRTPLGPTEWSFHDSSKGPSLWPSVGNWQQACQSHYVIKDGTIIWHDKWTPAQIAAGRRREEISRAAYYEAMYAKQGWLFRFWKWLRKQLHL